MTHPTVCNKELGLSNETPAPEQEQTDAPTCNVVSFKTRKVLTPEEIQALVEKRGPPPIKTKFLPGQLHNKAPSLANEAKRFRPDIIKSVGGPMIVDYFMNPILSKLAGFGYQNDMHWRELDVIYRALDSIIHREWGYKTPYHDELESEYSLEETAGTAITPDENKTDDADPVFIINVADFLSPEPPAPEPPRTA